MKSLAAASRLWLSAINRLMPLLIENKAIVTKPIGLARNEYKDKFAVGNAIRVTLLIPYVQQH